MHMLDGARAERTPFGDSLWAGSVLGVSNIVISVGMLPGLVFLPAGIAAYMAASSVTGYGLLAAFAVWCSRRQPGWRAVGFRRSSLPDMAGAVAVMALLYPLLMVLASMTAYFFPSSTLEMDDAALGAMDAMGPFFRFLSFAAMPAIGEEILCRGVLFSAARRYGRVCGILAPAVCFALLHGNLQQGAYALAAGIAMGFVRDATGSLYPCVAMHMAFNGVSALFPYLSAYIPVSLAGALALSLPFATVPVILCMYRRNIPLSVADGEDPAMACPVALIACFGTGLAAAIFSSRLL